MLLKDKPAGILGLLGEHTSSGVLEVKLDCPEEWPVALVTLSSQLHEIGFGTKAVYDPRDITGHIIYWRVGGNLNA